MQAGLLGHPPPGCPHLHPPEPLCPHLQGHQHHSRDYWPPATGNTSPRELGLHGHETWRASELSPTGSSNRDTRGCGRGWAGGYVNT